jgi:hypothetical protein
MGEEILQPVMLSGISFVMLCSKTALGPKI